MRTLWPWPGKAYHDAMEHSRRRSASREMNYGWSRPEVISRGEDYPANTNIGRKRGEIAPVMHMETLVPGQVQNVPYNAPVGSATAMPNGEAMIPTNVEGIAPTAEPTLVLPPTSQSGNPKSEARLVSYEEDEETTSRRRILKAKSGASANGSRKKLSAVPPKMDKSFFDAKRLPRNDIKQGPKESTGSSAIPVNPVRLNWSKVGATTSPKKVIGSSATVGRIVTRDNGDK